jgi:hypothetical protein
MQVGPHGGEGFGWIRGYFGEQAHLAVLDFRYDRHEQILARPEVVQQHSMARTDGVGYIAQWAVADAAFGEFFDECIQ